MLVFSNGIILFGGLFRSRETSFLVALPVRPVSLVLYRLLESVGFSSWAFLFLVSPLLVAYAGDQGLGPSFYPQALAFLLVFLFIPASIGALVTMGLVAGFPRSRRAVLIALAGVVLIAVGWLFADLLELRHRMGPGQEPSAYLLFEKVRFLLHPMMPSYWVSEGITNLGGWDAGRSWLFFRLTLANALFGMLLVALAARFLYLRGWWAGPGYRASRRIREGCFWRRILPVLLVPLGRGVRTLVIKDVKGFVRDPVQWSQFLIFFGLLAIYFANLRTFQYHHRLAFWKNIIAQLNLAATCLTLSTFTSRFVFPQLSLEGRRFWILGLVPMPRWKILAGKLCFAAAGALVVSLSLVLLSNVMLDVPRRVLALQLVSIAGVSLGLSGMAVGLGAIYPDFQEDNPSKIVSGFGGTLNLVLSLMLVGIVLVLQGTPCSLYMTGKLSAEAFVPAAALAAGGILVVCGLAAVVPIAVGVRVFRRMET
jgi:ABC-2 type transport system permease protein